MSLPQCPQCTSRARPWWPAAHVFRCSSCGLLFRYPAPSGQELDALYAASWEDPKHKILETGGTTPELASVYAEKLVQSIGRKSLSGLRILDYGAGRGDMLRALSEAGATAIGVEPFGWDFLGQEGFSAFPSISDLPEDMVFDGIISQDVIEHVQNPWAVYETLRHHLREDGWLYVGTPNAAGLNARYSRYNWREAHTAGHLFFFTASTLENVLRRAGYSKIVRLRWFIDYGRGFRARLVHSILQLSALEGELRYLARK
jgi:SAM-dependent methyltransferase